MNSSPRLVDPVRTGVLVESAIAEPPIALVSDQVELTLHRAGAVGDAHPTELGRRTVDQLDRRPAPPEFGERIVDLGNGRPGVPRGVGRELIRQLPVVLGLVLQDLVGQIAHSRISVGHLELPLHALVVNRPKAGHADQDQDQSDRSEMTSHLLSSATRPKAVALGFETKKVIGEFTKPSLPDAIRLLLHEAPDAGIVTVVQRVVSRNAIEETAQGGEEVLEHDVLLGWGGFVRSHCLRNLLVIVNVLLHNSFPPWAPHA